MGYAAAGRPLAGTVQPRPGTAVRPVVIALMTGDERAPGIPGLPGLPSPSPSSLRPGIVLGDVGEPPRAVAGDKQQRVVDSHRCPAPVPSSAGAACPAAYGRVPACRTGRISLPGQMSSRLRPRPSCGRCTLLMPRPGSSWPFTWMTSRPLSSPTRHRRCRRPGDAADRPYRPRRRYRRDRQGHGSDASCPGHRHALERPPPHGST